MNKLLVLALLFVPMSVSAESRYEVCLALAQLAGKGADARDAGITQSQYYQSISDTLRNNKVELGKDSRDLLFGLSTVAYVVPEGSKADIEREVYKICLESGK